MNRTSYFFFYGTLGASFAGTAARRAHSRLRPRGRARVRGRLWAIPDALGWYPALVAGKGWVEGELAVAAAFSVRDLAMLDHYEDFYPRRRAVSLYWRESAVARDGWRRRRPVQLYRYVGRVPKGALPIDGGDFADWLRQTGNRPYQAASRVPMTG
jgi:Uncharacterized conserved protein